MKSGDMHRCLWVWIRSILPTHGHAGCSVAKVTTAPPRNRCSAMYRPQWRFAMRSLSRVLIWVALVSLAWPTLLIATPTTAEEQRAFAWFDTLGFPKLDGCKWVHA